MSPQTRLPICLVLGAFACHRQQSIEAPDSDSTSYACVLEQGLGFGVELLGHVPFPRQPKTFVIFAAPAALVCERNTAEVTCDPMEGQAALGLGVIAQPSPRRSPELVAYRFLGDTLPVWASKFNDERPGALTKGEPLSSRSVVAHGESRAEDVDGDGSTEFVVFTIEHILVSTAGQSDVAALGRTRLVIVREDLSLQFDADVGQQARGGGTDGDRTFEDLVFTGERAMKVQWREFAAGSSDRFEQDTLCIDPTHELTLSYSVEADRYRVVSLASLEPGHVRSDWCTEGSQADADVSQ